jgi:plastocyanin
MPRLACALLLLIAAGIPARAAAGNLLVAVAGDDGRPAADAVVSLRSEGARPPIAAPATHVIDQQDETFIPYVAVFRPGDAVVFHNSDSTRHHVYSFAPARAFEFVIPSGDSSPPVTLATPGEIAVGCNIHDLMITHLYVSDAPWFGRTGADGRAAFKALPPGTYTVQVWHPQLRPGRPEPQREVAVGEADAEAAFVLPLLPDPRRDAGNRERSAY